MASGRHFERPSVRAKKADALNVGYCYPQHCRVVADGITGVHGTAKRRSNANRPGTQHPRRKLSTCEPVRSDSFQGSIQVSGDVPSLPWVRFRILVGAAFGIGLGPRVGVGGYVSRILEWTASTVFVLIMLQLIPLVKMGRFPSTTSCTATRLQRAPKLATFWRQVWWTSRETNWRINCVLMREMDAAKQTIADVSSVSPRSDEGRTLETSELSLSRLPLPSSTLIWYTSLSPAAPTQLPSSLALHSRKTVGQIKQPSPGTLPRSQLCSCPWALSL